MQTEDQGFYSSTSHRYLFTIGIAFLGGKLDENTHVFHIQLANYFTFRRVSAHIPKTLWLIVCPKKRRQRSHSVFTLTKPSTRLAKPGRHSNRLSIL